VSPVVFIISPFILDATSPGSPGYGAMPAHRKLGLVLPNSARFVQYPFGRRASHQMHLDNDDPVHWHSSAAMDIFVDARRVSVYIHRTFYTYFYIYYSAPYITLLFRERGRGGKPMKGGGRSARSVSSNRIDCGSNR